MIDVGLIPFLEIRSCLTLPSAHMGFQFPSSWEAVVLGRFHDSWRCPRRLKIALRQKNGKGVFYGSRRHDPNDLPSKVLEDLSKAFDMGKVERRMKSRSEYFQGQWKLLSPFFAGTMIRELDFSQDDLETQKLRSNLLQTPLLMVLLP